MAEAEDYSSGDSSEELSSDEELQAEFAKGNLGSGLIKRVAPPRTYTNNIAGLKESLAALQLNKLDWIERMDVTAVEPRTDEEINPEDDFKREMHFYEQALSSVRIGLRKLEELGVPTERPEDYFAEMVKTDDHMRKVRQNLLAKKKLLEKKEKVRKLREQKKYGKKVQQEILKKRKEEKKASLEAIKKFRKGKGEKPSFLDNKSMEDDFPVAAASSGKDSKMAPREKSRKRQFRDEKYGFGGKKKRLKSNTAASTADMSSFSSARHSKTSSQPRGGFGGIVQPGKKVKQKQRRLGKSRRQKMKLKR